MHWLQEIAPKGISSHQTLNKWHYLKNSKPGWTLPGTHSLQEKVCVGVFVYVCTLCSTEARLYVMSRDEITVD